MSTNYNVDITETNPNVNIVEETVSTSITEENLTINVEGNVGGGGGVTDHTLLTNIGTLSHVILDAHVLTTTIHFTQAQIDHVNILSVGTNTHDQIDTHIADTSIHTDLETDTTGTTFPGSPYSGQMFYRTDLNDTFWYDDSRSKWLGHTLTDGCGGNGAISTTGYYKRFNGMTMNATNQGLTFPYDVTITGASISNNTAVASGVVDGVIASVTGNTLLTFDGNTQVTNDSVNIDVNSNIVFAIKNNSISSTDDPQIIIYYKRRAS